jgi:hypothetical protein
MNMARKKKKAHKRTKRAKKGIKALRRARDHAKKVMSRKRSKPASRKAAKKAYKRLYKTIKKKTGRNPMGYVARDRMGQLSNKREVETVKEVNKRIAKIVAAAKKKAGGRLDESQMSALDKQIADIRSAHGEDVMALRKEMATYRGQPGYTAKSYIYEAGSRKAKPKKKPKKKAAKKAAKKKGGRKGKRKSAQTALHRHARSTRHLIKGSKAKFSARKKRGAYKITAKFGRGKRKVKMTGTARVKKNGILSGLFRINPFRSNPMNMKTRSNSKFDKYLGVDGAEVSMLIGAAALAPFVKKGVMWVASKAGMGASIAPYLDTVAPLLTGIALNAALENDKTKDMVPMPAVAQHLADAMVLIGLVQGSFIVAQQVMANIPGLSGVNYTPSMRGMGIVPQLNGMGDVRYTPSMRGVNYTPMSGLGSSADFGSADYGGGGGYTEGHNRSRADFGANFSEDSEAEGLNDQNNSYSSSMS